MPYHVNSKMPKSNVEKNKEKAKKQTAKKPVKKEMTLKEAIAKFEDMPNKPKSNMKSSGKLSKRQSDLMKTHKEHHTKLHLDLMKYLMVKKNYCFEISHELTQKIVGK